MGTPQPLPKEHPFAPVKYDVEDSGLGLSQKDRKNLSIPDVDTMVQIKDWDNDEDKEILESIKYAENKLGAKMGTPKTHPKEHAYDTLKNEVEQLSQKD